MKSKSLFEENRNFIRESYIDKSSGVTVDHYYPRVYPYGEGVVDGWIGHSFSMEGPDEKIDALISNIINFFNILEKNKKLSLYL